LVTPTGLRPSRRNLLLGGLGGLGAVASASLIDVATASAAQASRPASTSGSLRRAATFLDAAHDAYPAANPGLTLAQSYADELGLFSTGFIYDNALAVLGHLAADQTQRAKVLADAILYAQDHDPGYSDGRLRQAYNVGPYTFYDGNPSPYGFITPDGSVNIGWQFGFLGTAVGDMAWPGLALAHTYDATSDPRYLKGALKIADWIVTHARSSQPLGGFSGGVSGSNTPYPYSSTEHNIDCVGFFSVLAKITHDSQWREQADHARAFVEAMWQPKGGFFYTGTNDGSTVNTSPVPQDVQTWSWMALRDRRFATSIDWAANNLATTDSIAAAHSQLPAGVSLTGVTFSSSSLTSTASYNGLPVDQQGVWLEGTGHFAAALLDRDARRDSTRAAAALASIRTAQASVGVGQHLGGALAPAASGIVAASSLIDTGFYFGYFQVQHVGATAWYLLAGNGSNPYQRHGL
jgi:hypothetical protein